MNKFGKQVEAFVKETNLRLRLVLREAVQETISKAQRVMIRSDASPEAVLQSALEGGDGRMPVITGFLRASILATIDKVPSGQSDNPGKEEFSVGSYVGEPVSVALLKWDPNRDETLYVGWTAHYAKYVEAHRGFMQGAVELWDVNVKKAVKKVERERG